MADPFSTTVSPSAAKLLKEKVFGVLPPSYSPAPTNPQDWSSPTGTLAEDRLQLPEDSLAELRKWFIGQQNQSTELAKSGSLRLGVSPAAVEQALIGKFDPAELGVNALDHIIKTYGRPSEGVQDTLSMIPTLKNLGEFIRRMKQARAFDIEKFPEAAFAEKFIHARYPKLSAQLFPLKVEDSNIFNAGTAGYFSALKDRVTLVNQGGSRNNLNPRSTFDMTTNLGHEGTHARDKRNPVSVVPIEQFYTPETEVPGKPGVFGTYVTPEASVKAVGDLSLYEKQISEERARQFGAVAGDEKEGALKKFLDLLPDVQERRQGFAGTPQNRQHEIATAAAMFNHAEKSMKKELPIDEFTKIQPILRERKSKVLKDISEQTDFYTRNNFKVPDYKPYYENLGDAFYAGKIPYSAVNIARNRMNPEMTYNFAGKSQDELKIAKLIKEFQAAEGIGNITGFMKKQMDLEKKYAEDEIKAKIRSGYLDQIKVKTPQNSTEKMLWDKLTKLFGEGDITKKLFEPPAK